MTKRFFAWVLVLALLLSLMPAVTLGVGAEGEDKHTSHEGWTAWSDKTKLPAAAGKYYLTVDVTLTAQWTVPTGETHLCLGGHHITQTVSSKVIGVNAGRTLSVYDCAPAYEGQTYVGGTISGGTGSDHGHGIWVARGNAGGKPGVFNLYGGRITGNKYTGSANAKGGAVYLQSGKKDQIGGVFNMYGGELYDNQASLGGAVYLHGESSANRGQTPATFTMYGGKIWKNTASKYTASGTTDGGHGSAIYGMHDAVIHIQGGEILENNAESTGTIYVRDDMVLTVSKATIRGNKTVNASAIYGQQNVKITIKDSVITENISTAASAEGYGAAVYMTGSKSRMTLGGALTITGNTCKAAGIADLYLNSSSGADIETVYVDGITAGQVNFGVHDTTVTKAADVVAFADPAKTGYASGSLCYIKGIETKYVGLESSTFVFTDGHFHGSTFYAAWNDGTKLPSSGTYYLNTDVTLANYDAKAKVTGGKDLNLCLNGHTIDNKKNIVVQESFRVENAKLHLTDCTTRYDENGHFVSGGKITGGMKKGNGAVIYANNASAQIVVEGIAFVGNESTETNVAYGGGVVQLRKNTTPAQFIGCLFSENVSAGGGGAIALREGGNASFEKCLFTRNRAAQAGAIYVNASTLALKDCKFTGNTTSGAASVMNILGVSTVTIQDTTVTGNTGGAAEYGTVNLGGGNSKVKLLGKVIITDNTVKGGVQQNLHLQQYDNVYYDVSGLTAGSEIGITLLGSRISAGLMHFTANGMTENPGYIRSDDPSYKVVLDDQSRLALEEVVVIKHDHKLCNDDACTSHGDTVSFLPWTATDSLPTSGYYYLTQDIQLTGAATINKQDVYLCLNGHTVTAAEKNRHYLLEPGATLAITDCSETVGGFTGGDLDYGGSVNMAPGSTVNLYAGKFYGNNSNMGGGAIYLRGDNATASGAAFHMYGGEIAENTTAANGAGIFINAGAQLQIHNGKITGNTAAGNGAGIFATGKNALIIMNGGTINGNTAKNGGGLITQSDSAFILNAGTISGNKAASGGGGAYISTNTSFQMNGGIISENTANNGGGFYALRSQVTLDGGTISSNKTATSAGAFRAEGATVVLNKITIERNSSKDGGTAYILRATVASGDQKQYVPSQVTVNEGALITGNKGESNSGGFLIANEGVVVTVNGGEFSKNTAANGGALMTWSGSTLILNGGKISDNSVKDNGGGIYVSSKSTFKMNGGTISGNTAKNGGGAYMLRANVDLVGGTISYNTATHITKVTNGKETKDGGNAGGIYISGAKVNLRGTSIMGNKASVNGGAIVMSFASHKENGITIRSNVLVNIYGGTISGNIAQNAAGGMLIQSEGTVVNMYGGTFTNNTAKNAGGIYVSTKTQFHMTGGAVANNRAVASAGGIYVLNAAATITGGQFYGNTAATSGGVLVTSGAATVVRMENVKVHDNKALTHGAIFIQGKATFLANNCDFYDNTAGSGGNGGVCIGTQCKGELKNCKFYGNSSEATSGAMMISTMAEVSIENCDFTENHAATLGGVMYTNPASQVTIKNSTFSKNTAGTRGGAITCKGNMFLIDCTLENNSAAADGGAVYTDVNAANGSGVMRGLVVENSQIRNNTSGGKGGGFYIYMGCRLELHNCQVTGNSAALEGGAVWAFEDLELHNTKITGNGSGGDGFAVYMNDANFDGHSYFANANKLSGNVIVKDNQGGDLYMGPDVFFAITAEGLGEDTHMEVTLDSGVLTQRILGAYHYEGGDQVYTVTYGTKSMTDPECDTTLAGDWETEPQQKQAGDILLYVGIGVIGLAAMVAVVLVARKKKKAEKTAETIKEN